MNKDSELQNTVLVPPVRLKTWRLENDNRSAGPLPRIVWRDREPGSSLQCTVRTSVRGQHAGQTAGHDNSHYPLVRTTLRMYRTSYTRRTRQHGHPGLTAV